MPLLLMAICLSARGQGLPVTVAIAPTSTEVANVAKVLTGKLNTALNDAGIHSAGEAGMFLAAELTPLSSETVEGGMRKIRINKYELHLKVEQPILSLQFGALTIPLNGSGYDDAKAAMDAVRSINASSSSLRQFLTSSVQKASEYYETSISSIIQKAMALSKNRQFDEAIALLWAVPATPSLQSQVYPAIETIFAKMQRDQCSNIVAAARNAYAMKDYQTAADLLNTVLAESDCGAEARQLSERIGTEIRTAEREQQAREDRREEREFTAAENERNRRHATERARINANARTERARLNATSQIAKAYYGSLRRNIYYVF